MYILMVVEIACAVIVDKFSHLVSFVVSIIMLVSGCIAQLYNAILCVLWAFVVPAYVPENKV